jgi:flagellar protein FliS
VTGYASARQAYTEAAVLTATPERLVVMLFEGANSVLARTAAALRADDPALAMRNAQRAVAIVDELNFSLDMSYGDVPERLRAIYLFHKRSLVEAVIARDPEAVETIAELLRELADAFTQIADGAVAGGPIPGGPVHGGAVPAAT